MPINGRTGSSPVGSTMIRLEVPYWEDKAFIEARIQQQDEEIERIKGRDVPEDRKKELLASAQFIKDRFVKYLFHIEEYEQS